MVVAADDTDIEVMLLYHHQNRILDTYFFQERGKNTGALKKLSKKLHAKNICFLYMHDQDATLLHQYLEK